MSKTSTCYCSIYRVLLEDKCEPFEKPYTHVKKRQVVAFSTNRNNVMRYIKDTQSHAQARTYKDTHNRKATSYRRCCRALVTSTSSIIRCHLHDIVLSSLGSSRSSNARHISFNRSSDVVRLSSANRGKIAQRNWRRRGMWFVFRFSSDFPNTSMASDVACCFKHAMMSQPLSSHV